MELILTNTGETLAAQGFITGVFPRITKVWFGDGGGVTTAPDKTRTALVNKVFEGVGTTIVRSTEPNRLDIYTVIPASVGGFIVREIGLLTDDNTLIATGGNTENIKPNPLDEIVNMEWFITLPLTSSEQVTVEFSNDNIYAFQASVDYITNNLEGHMIDTTNPHNVTKAQVGLGNVSNLAPADLPLSNASNTALNLKIDKASIADTLLSTDPTKVLSAKQGYILKGFIDNINTLLNSDNTALDTLQEVIDFIETNRSILESLAISNIAGLQAALNLKLDAAQYTAADVLAKIKTVDGSGSGLDADLLDGMNSSTGNTANTIVARDASGNFTAGTITANLTGNASTASTLQTGRLINGTSFNGGSDITTAKWGTSRNITIGNTTKAVDGSAAMSWSIAEMGVATSGHDHNGMLYRGNTTDFNTSLTEGTYNLASATSVTNAPYTGAIYGTLVVYVNDGTTHNNSTNNIQQEFNDINGKRFTRSKSNANSWTTWLEATKFVTNITAGSGVIVSGTAGTSWTPTISLANIGTAGTYSKVTTDVHGRVISGSEMTMEDIPTASFKRSVVVATTANISLNGIQTIDGIVLVAGDRVLVRGQNTMAENGIYVVSANAWTRPLDADSSGDLASAIVNVERGTTYGGQTFCNTFRTTDTLGTTSMTWFRMMYESGGTWGINISGNAGTATTLQTARTINGVTFNGSANIVITASTPSSHTIKFDSGTTEGTNQYTFNGSAAKSIDFRAGTNVTLTKSAGVVTISANDTSVDWSEIQNKPDPTVTVTLSGDTTGTANTTLTDLASGTVNITTVNDKVNGVLTNSIAAASKSQAVLTGGGTIVIGANGEVSWSARFIAIGDGNGTHYARSGFFDILCPTSGTITGVGGATNKTATAAGIPLAEWDSIYYIPPINGVSTSVPANFRVVNYTESFTVEPHWIKICTRYADTTPNYVLFTNGVKLPLSSSLNTHVYGEYRSLTADTFTTARTIGINGDATGTATSFNGSDNITIPLTLANTGVTAGTYSKVTVDAKGRVTAGAVPTMEDIPDATFKRSVRCATTANIAATYASNVLTASAVGVTVIDGITVALNDRVLIKDQSTPAHNGIYRVSVLGTASVATVFTRTTDADSITEIASALVAIDSGTVNGGKLFDNDLKTTDTLDTTSMNWSMNLDDASLLVSTSASIGTVKYNGTTDAAGMFNGGTTIPTGSNRLNYGGYFYPTFLNLSGSGDTSTASSHVFVETGSDGFVRPKTLDNFKTEIFASPTLVTPNIGVATGTSFNSITGLASVAPIVAGTAAVGTSTLTARQDHVHPAQTTITGNAGTATTLQTARTIGASGDVTGTATSFNGSANITIPMTLANTGVTAGTYSKVTVDAKGRVTAGAVPTMEDIPDATFKRSVRCATTATITLSGTQTIDGIAVVAGDRVLVKDQTTSSQNGIYVVAAGAWTRSLDADSSSKIASAIVAVDSGTLLGGKLFDNDFKTIDTLGTTAMTWNTNLDDGSLLTAGSTAIGMIKYNGTTAAAGQFDGGTTTPSGSTRLNFGGYFYPTYISLIGSADTSTASSHVFVETGSDGFVRPKTLANFKSEIFASPTLVTPNIGVATGTSFNSITGLASVAPIVAGTAAVGTSTLTARQDHVHPAQTTITGNAGTATTLQTARTINGVSFNGSANINIEDRLGSAIASADTTTIGTAGLGDYMHITGTTTITSFGTASAPGVRRTLIFDGALQITHNATSLICPGSANIVTIAGTVIEVVSETTVNWRVVSISHPTPSRVIGTIDFNGSTMVIANKTGIVTGVTRTATGWYTVTLNGTVSSYTCAIAHSGGGQGYGVYLNSRTSTNIILETGYGGDNTVGRYNPGIINLIIFGV